MDTNLLRQLFLIHSNPIYEISMTRADNSGTDVEYRIWNLITIESEALRRTIPFSILNIGVGWLRRKEALNYMNFVRCRENSFLPLRERVAALWVEQSELMVIVPTSVIWGWNEKRMFPMENQEHYDVFLCHSNFVNLQNIKKKCPRKQMWLLSQI